MNSYCSKYNLPVEKAKKLYGYKEYLLFNTRENSTNGSIYVTSGKNDEIFVINDELFKAKTYCFQMEVGDQAMYLAQLKGLSASDARRELKQWFVRFGIQDWWKKKVEELSKGMAQKLQFITTVVHKPSLMILDEPFSGFDPVNAELIRKEILRLKDEGATIILSTHNMESVEELCDKIALINKSHLVITGEVDRIRREHGNNNIELIYTGENNLSDAEGLFTVLSDNDNAGRHTAVLTLSEGVSSNSVLSSLLESGVTVNSFKELIPRMNDIFIKLVTQEEA